MIINTPYLLSIDPSMQNTAFCLWEKKEKWKPIFITEYNFKKYNDNNFRSNLTNFFEEERPEEELNYWEDMCINLSLCIEKGFINLGKGKETLEHLRGFIAGQFYKLLTKDMLVHNLTWKKWYKEYFLLENKIHYIEWNKNFSIEITNNLIKKYNWDIKITNHDQAEAVLIGWYYINKE